MLFPEGLRAESQEACRQSNPNRNLQPAFLAPLAGLIDNKNSLRWVSQTNGKEPICSRYWGSENKSHWLFLSKIAGSAWLHRLYYWQIQISLVFSVENKAVPVLVMNASGVVRPCDKDTNADPDRDETSSCCHSCNWLLPGPIANVHSSSLCIGSIFFLIKS